MNTFRIVKKVKRKPGQRAGLTHTKIIDASLKRVENHYSRFSVLRLAKGLGVGPRAIYIKFPQGQRNIETAMLSAVFETSLPNIVQGASWKAAIRDLFRQFSVQYVGHPKLAALLVREFAENELALPLLQERILAIIASAGVKGPDTLNALEFVVGSLAGMVTAMPVPKQLGNMDHHGDGTFFVPLEHGKGSLLANHGPMIASRRNPPTQFFEKAAVQRADNVAKFVAYAIQPLKK